MSGTGLQLVVAGVVLVLGATALWATRSARRSVRSAQIALLAGAAPPLLLPTRFQDSAQEGSTDARGVRVPGGHGIVRLVGEAIYIVLSIRNAGSSAAVFHGWQPFTEFESAAQPRPALDEFRDERTASVPAHNAALWEGAIGNRSDDAYGTLVAAIEQRRRIAIDLFYSDDAGGQRTISRFVLIPSDGSAWPCAVVRHWKLGSPMLRRAG